MWSLKRNIFLFAEISTYVYMLITHYIAVWILLFIVDNIAELNGLCSQYNITWSLRYYCTCRGCWFSIFLRYGLNSDSWIIDSKFWFTSSSISRFFLPPFSFYLRMDSYTPPFMPKITPFPWVTPFVKRHLSVTNCCLSIIHV